MATNIARSQGQDGSGAESILAESDTPHETRETSGAQMSLVDHLEELRYRLFFCIVAVGVGAVVAFVFYEPILQFLLSPLPSKANALATHNGKPQIAVTGIGEGFSIVLKLAIAVGFITLRYPLNWLLSFGDQYFVEIITADNYFTFVAYFLLAFGLTFELPLVLTFLAVMGIVSSQQLRKNRAAILIGLWIASCFITPGADPYSPLIIGVAFTVLYFLSEGLIHSMR